MSEDRFKACLAETLKWEGGWSNHPKDPGGATMKGVIQKVYDAWREGHGDPKQSVRNITDADVHAIYAANYWRVVGGHMLPAGLDLAVFDFGVNSGPTRAISYLQSCLGIAQDGHMGAVTVEAATRADAVELVPKYMAARRKFLRSLKTYRTFGKGWERRCSGIEGAAMAMLNDGKSPPIPQPLPNPEEQSAGQGRAVSEPKPASKVAVATATAAAASGAATVVNQTITAPPPELTTTVTNIGLWQSIGRQCAEFGKFIMGSPLEVGLIAAAVVAVWFAPRLLPAIWSRAK